MIKVHLLIFQKPLDPIPLPDYSLAPCKLILHCDLARWCLEITLRCVKGKVVIVRWPQLLMELLIHVGTVGIQETIVWLP